jgi:gamma-glutamylcyclotransferase
VSRAGSGGLAEDIDGRRLLVVAYIARGKEVDGKPSLRYINLLRNGARAHGLPAHYIRFLESVEPMQEV